MTNKRPGSAIVLIYGNYGVIIMAMFDVEHVYRVIYFG